MRTDFYGDAGANARRLAHRRRRTRLGTWSVALILGAIAALGGWYLATLGLFIAARVVTRRLRRGEARAHAGARGEERVAAHLSGLRVEAVVFDLPLRRGDADILVLGPMAAVVEVKHARGRVRTRRDGSVAVSGRSLPGRPLRQAVAAAASVAELVGPAIWVDAVVCVTGMIGRTRVWTEDGHEVYVCSARRLKRTLRRLPRPLPRGRGRDLAHDLMLSRHE
jgi:hypothetical protein